MKQKIDIPVEEIIERWVKRETQEKLAQEYGVSETTIRNRINEYYGSKGIEKPKFEIELPIEEIIERWKNRETQEKLAQEYGVSRSTISKKIKEYYEIKGEKKPDLRIQLPVEEIVEKLRRGVNEQILAEEYGVSTPTINKRIKEHYEIKGEEKPDLRIQLPVEEIIEKLREGVNKKSLAKVYGVSETLIRTRLNEYYDNNDIKDKYRVLKGETIIVQYLKKGLTPEQIREVAKNSKIIIPQSVMDSAIAKVEGQKTTMQSEEERDK